MPTDTAPGRTAAISFAARSVAWSLGIFGLLRLNWAEAHAVLPFTRVQAGLAATLFGTPASPVEATLACSGADALALCLGAVLAYPVAWRSRVAAAAGGFGLILVLNTLRIGTLGRAAASPLVFNTLHLYIWPAALTLAIAGYVFGWMRRVDRRPPPADDRVPGPGRLSERPLPTRRFVLLTAGFLVLFAAASPLYLGSATVLALAGVIASAAARILGAAGVTVHATDNLLWTARGGFLVTQECISTPLIPVYLAAVCAYARTWRSLGAGVLAALPLFTALGILRLLVVALPEAIASPLFVVHAFYQLLLGAVVVLLAALWRHGRRTAPWHALVGIGAGVLFVYLLGPTYTRIVSYHSGVGLDDPQGAIAFLPAFQGGLYLALWAAAFAGIGWKRPTAGLAVLALSQSAVLIGLHTLASQSLVAVQVRDVRGWAVAAPVLIFGVVAHRGRPRH